MFGYEHERVCFAHIGECDGGMSATIPSVTVGYKYRASATPASYIFSPLGDPTLMMPITEL